MPEVSAERVRILAAAARIPIAPQSAERIAGAISPAVKRLSDANLALPFETEPATFLSVQQKEIAR
jgi:hypothetical protein